MAKKKISHRGQISAGLAVTAAMAAAAGAYFLYGSKGAAKNRKVVRGWMLRAKGEVLEGVEKVKHLDEKSYHELIDKVMKRYRKMRRVSDKEAAELRRELKGHWRSIHKGAAMLIPKKKTRLAKAKTRRTATKKHKTTKRKTTRRKKK